MNVPGSAERQAHPEMMLNTDMCLVYKDALADESNCCAWERFPTLQNLGISDTHNGEPIYCGFQKPFASEPFERDWCCGLEHVLPDDCPLQGPAVDAVNAFAANESQWLTEFKIVWKLATTKGAGSLTTLVNCAPSTPTSAYYTSTTPNLSCQLLHQITTSSACQEAAADLGGTFQYNIHYSVWNQWYAGCNRVGDRFYFKGNFATADDFNEIPENRRSVCLVSAMQ